MIERLDRKEHIGEIREQLKNVTKQYNKTLNELLNISKNLQDIYDEINSYEVLLYKGDGKNG